MISAGVGFWGERIREFRKIDSHADVLRYPVCRKSLYPADQFDGMERG